MEKSPSEIYQEKVSDYNKESSYWSGRFNRWSAIRTIYFLLAVVALVYFANDRNYLAVSAVALSFPIIFGLIIRHHNRIRYKKNHAFFLGEINKGELLRLEGNLHSFYKGDEYNQVLHPYTSDLDIFGNNSLFQLLNRTTTGPARELLANWLKKAANLPDILNRQEAIKELSPKVEWRQNFEASGKHYAEDQDNLKILMLWMKEPIQIKKRKLYILALWIMPALAIASILLWAFWDVSFYLPLLILVLNTLILRSVFVAAGDITEKTSKSVKGLKAYKAMIGQIESETFQAETLKNIQHSFDREDLQASREIKKLQIIVDNLQARNNAYYWLLNVIFIFDIYWLLKLEKWKVLKEKDISIWLDSISDFEVLSSLSGFHYSNPSYSFPEIASVPHKLSAISVGHPLIKNAKRVNNDFSMEGKIAIITGSNMAGKSTFLRTVGCNVVLALMGAPVCASAMTVSLGQVFTSMRTEDNLEENVSSFYAELKRLKQLISMVGEGIPVLFMLDEILKGTNSKDRHIGATALIKQLNEGNASGFVSTHDVELGQLEGKLQGLKNYSFNSEIINDEIIFDYKIQAGVCKGFNASKLMEKMGIAINARN